MRIEIKEGNILLGLIANGMFSDRYNRESYDALIEHHTSFGVEYIIASSYCLEDGTWGSGSYFNNYEEAKSAFLSRY